MLDYIILVLLFHTLFLTVYELILKNETFFQWNRLYLLLTSILTYVIPLIKVEEVTQVVSKEYYILLPEIVLSPQAVIKEQFDWSAFLFTSLKWIYGIGIFVAGILFLVKLFKVVQLIRFHEKEKEKNYRLVYLDHYSPFSFFNYIFLNKSLLQKDKQQIIEHELVHVKQKHSLDLLFFELQRILFWFNPYSYIYQNRIAELHEFIADSKSIKTTARVDYFQNLLNSTFGTHKISFINPFFKQSLIKKRIVMLNKDQSKQSSKFKYFLVFPLILVMLIYNSYAQSKSIEAKHENEKKEMVIYRKSSTDFIEGKRTGVESYFDVYEMDSRPVSARTVSYFDLTDIEKEDFARLENHLKPLKKKEQ